MATPADRLGIASHVMTPLPSPIRLYAEVPKMASQPNTSATFGAVRVPTGRVRGADRRVEAIAPPLGGPFNGRASRFADCLGLVKPEIDVHRFIEALIAHCPGTAQKERPSSSRPRRPNADPAAESSEQAA